MPLSNGDRYPIYITSSLRPIYITSSLRPKGRNRFQKLIPWCDSLPYMVIILPIYGNFLTAVCTDSKVILAQICGDSNMIPV